MIEIPRAIPMISPTVRITSSRGRERVKADRICGLPGLEMANAKTAFR